MGGAEHPLGKPAWEKRSRDTGVPEGSFESLAGSPHNQPVLLRPPAEEGGQSFVSLGEEEEPQRASGNPENWKE